MKAGVNPNAYNINHAAPPQPKMFELSIYP